MEGYSYVINFELKKALADDKKISVDLENNALKLFIILELLPILKSMSESVLSNYKHNITCRITNFHSYFQFGKHANWWT